MSQKNSQESHFISCTAQLLRLTRVKIECFLIRSTDFYEMFIFASPAQFSPLLFYWMVSWWPNWLHSTFLPLAEGNWQVCNYLFNEADLSRPVENIMRHFNILAITKNHQNKHRMKDISLIYPSIERANDTPLSRPFSLACYLHIIAIFCPIVHYKEQSLLNVTARLWHKTCPA